MQQFFNIGLPSAAPEKGLSPARFTRNMSCPTPINQYDVVQLRPETLDSDNLAWTDVIPLRGNNNATVQDTDIYGVVLDTRGASSGGIVEVGFYGDFPVKCASSITNSAGSTNALNGVRLVANTTNNATASSASSSAHSNWLIPMGSLNTTQTTANHVTSPFNGQKVLGFIISSGASASSSVAGATHLVRFNGFGWGNGAF